MTRFTLKWSAPIFWIVKQFWIFPQFIFLNFLTNVYLYIVYSRFTDSAKTSRIHHFWKNFPFPCSSRTLVRALVHESKNACSRWNVRPFFSTGVAGLYTILNVRLWRKVCEKSVTRFHKVKHNSTNLFPQVSLIIPQTCTRVNIICTCILYTYNEYLIVKKISISTLAAASR